MNSLGQVKLTDFGVSAELQNSIGTVALAVTVGVNAASDPRALCDVRSDVRHVRWYFQVYVPRTHHAQPVQLSF